MSTLAKLFGAHIRIYRNKLGLTQAELASRLNLSEEMIGKLERGSAGASFKTIEKLCNVFEVQPSDLFPSKGMSLNENDGALGEILLLLSKLNHSELVWVKGILREVIRRP